MTHIIVIFDCSGSMGEPFSTLIKPRKRKYRLQEIKIEAAKSSLLDWLQSSKFDFVTIIPFSSKVEGRLTASIVKNKKRIRNFIFKQTPGGNTNLQAAILRAIKIASKDTENSYIQYLIVTDGLSHTTDQDIKLVKSIPTSQGISGILIDPTLEGEKHLRRLCVRGSYMSVRGMGELVNTLERQGKTYGERINLSKIISRLVKKNNLVTKNLEKSEKRIKNLSRPDKDLEKIISTSAIKIKKLKESEQNISNRVADQTKDISQVADDLYKIEQEQANLEIIVDILEKYEQLLQQSKLLVLHPRFLAKGYPSILFVHIFPIDNQIKDLKRQLRSLGAAKRFYNTVLTVGMNATTKLECQQIKFSNEITNKFLKGENVLKFMAEPEKQSSPGHYKVFITIYNKTTGKEYITREINLETLDFAFAQVSYPSLIRWSIILFGLIFLALIICILIGIIDKPIGSLLSAITFICAAVGVIIFVKEFKKYRVQ